MKVRSTVLASIVILLCLVFSRVLIAEYGSAGRSIMPQTLKDRHKHQKRDRLKDLRTKDSIHQKHFQENSVAKTSSDTWEIESVDASKYLKDLFQRAIAVDGSSNPHIAYGGDHLYYAYYDGSIWHYEMVDASPDVGSYASLAIDASGKVHISYYERIYDEDDEYGNLKYATNASGAWVTTTIDSDGVVGLYTSIAVDSSDMVHISYISYYDYDNYDLKYATNASGEWVTTTVDEFVGGYTSIAIDSDDKVHISYYDYDNDDLKYATNVSGEWVTTTVDSDGAVGGYTSIAIDSGDKVHISYYDYDNYDLKYATNASGKWVTTTVDSDGAVGLYTSIAIDSGDKVHISYYEDGYGNLKYAAKAFPTPRIYGYVMVKDDRYFFNPTVPYAKVTIKSSKNRILLQTSTNSKGYFEFTDLPAGKYEIKVTKIYCKSLKKTVILKDRKEKKVMIKLEKEGDCWVDWGGNCFIKIINELDSEISIKFEFQYNNYWYKIIDVEQEPGTCELWGAYSKYKYKVTIKKHPNGPKKSKIFNVGKNKIRTISVTDSFF